MSSPFKITVHGRSGHASMPGIADNALVKAAPLIEKLAAYRPEASIGPEVAGFLDAVLGEQPPADQVLERLRAVDPLAVETIEPLLSFTLSPTMIAASERRNVIPGTVRVDRRPAAAARSDARGRRPDHPLESSATAGTTSWRRSSASAEHGHRSTRRSGSAISGWVETSEPGAKLAPLCCAGFTDSHWLREAFGTVAYGFFPLRTMETELASRLIHSADERTHVDDLGLGVDFLRAAARSLA